jgi:hypothetical protein
MTFVIYLMALRRINAIRRKESRRQRDMKSLDNLLSNPGRFSHGLPYRSRSAWRSLLPTTCAESTSYRSICPSAGIAGQTWPYLRCEMKPVTAQRVSFGATVPAGIFYPQRLEEARLEIFQRSLASHLGDDGRQDVAAHGVVEKMGARWVDNRMGEKLFN